MVLHANTKIQQLLATDKVCSQLVQRARPYIGTGTNVIIVVQTANYQFS